ncbi:MAG TPA: hypothetical protein VMB34_20610 [Acetobacteraceae bacterium]|nr:hypothetical protein [Acetobacteraceae bacterium]
MPVMPSTARRVEQNTDPAINHRIRRRAEENIHYYANHPEQIEQRLAQLDREWDVERVLETQAAALALTGTLLGLTRDRRYLALPALVSGFLLQHALQGWCPPVPLLRRLGVRTAAEIAGERGALKALRGDFAAVEKMPNAAERAHSAYHAASA